MASTGSNDLRLLLNTLDCFDKKYVEERPSDIHEAEWDRYCAILQLEGILQFLNNCGIGALALDRLHTALVAVHDGATPPKMLIGERHGGRPLDHPMLEVVKAYLAAAMAARQHSGATGQQAAEWVVRKISPALSKAISKKPIKPSTIKEWLGRFAGHSDEGYGRINFQRATEHNFSAEKCVDLAEHLAKNLPT
jgi:hypothetical protein